MDPHRTARRVGVTAATTALLAGMLLGVASTAWAAPGTCHVTNLASGTSSTGGGRNLQHAIQTADPGDTLRITGRCNGGFIVDKRLTLRGRATSRFPVPTLDGGGDRRVLFVGDRAVTIRDLRITNGDARFGGGIYNDGGNLTLAGSTVTGNAANRGGGGVVNDRGRLVLSGSSIVGGNVATTLGGGIYNYLGTLIMNGSSRVRANDIDRKGGGVYTYGTMIMNDASAVTGNSTAQRGGGVYDLGTLRLNDTAAVTGNTAGVAGGGVFLVEGKVFTCSVDVALGPNSPDDPPTTTDCS